MTESAATERSVQESGSPRHRLGLALGGGGVRGLAHIGVLKALDRAGIPVTCIAGTSAGGLVGATYAAGISPAVVEESIGEIVKVSGLLSLGEGWPGKRSLFSGKGIYKFFANSVGDVKLVEEMGIPFAAVAVDILSGEEVVLRRGEVIEVLAATMAMPGVFDPVHLNGFVLVDGGLRNNVPVDVTRTLGADVVLAVNLSLVIPPVTESELPKRMKIANDLTRSLHIMMRSLTDYRIALSAPDVVISPVMPEGVSTMAGLQKYKAIVDAGEEATEAVIPQLRALLGHSALLD